MVVSVCTVHLSIVYATECVYTVVQSRTVRNNRAPETPFPRRVLLQGGQCTHRTRKSMWRLCLCAKDQWDMGCLCGAALGGERMGGFPPRASPPRGRNSARGPSSRHFGEYRVSKLKPFGVPPCSTFPFPLKFAAVFPGVFFVFPHQGYAHLRRRGFWLSAGEL